MQGFRRNSQNKIAGDQNTKIQTAGLVSTPQTTWNPAHRRPWLKMRIEYHPPLIFNAFCEEFSSRRCLHILWLNSIGKLGKWCFRLRETMIFIVFGNDVTTLSMQGLVSFFLHLIASILRQQVLQVFQEFSRADIAETLSPSPHVHVLRNTGVHATMSLDFLFHSHPFGQKRL
jgi:hypothetical protein